MAVITDILKRNPVFAALSDDELEALGQLARDRPYRRGEVVFLQGDEGDALYGIHAGQVRVSIDSPDGETRFLNLLGAGEVFGEIALLDGGARTATATAMEPARLAVIERSAFLDLVMGRPQLAIRLLASSGADCDTPSDSISA